MLCAHHHDKVNRSNTDSARSTDNDSSKLRYGVRKCCRLNTLRHLDSRVQRVALRVPILLQNALFKRKVTDFLYRDKTAGQHTTETLVSSDLQYSECNAVCTRSTDANIQSISEKQTQTPSVNPISSGGIR